MGDEVPAGGVNGVQRVDRAFHIAIDRFRCLSVCVSIDVDEARGGPRRSARAMRDDATRA